MRDGAIRPPTTSTQQATWMPERVQVAHWRGHSRLDVLRDLAEGAGGLALSRRLLNLLLEELHISDDFDVLVGPLGRLPASQFPRLLAIALLLRHSWCPQDLARTVTRIGLSRSITAPGADLTPEPHKPRDRGHRHRGPTGARPSRPRAR